MKQWQSDFITNMATANVLSDLPPATTQVFAWLLICEEPLQSAADIQRELNASSGSVSTALTNLHYLGLIEKVPTQGSRKLLYRASSDSAARLLQAQAETTRKLAQISEAALKHAPKNKQLHAAQKLSTQLLRAFKNMREFKK